MKSPGGGGNVGTSTAFISFADWSYLCASFSSAAAARCWLSVRVSVDCFLTIGASGSLWCLRAASMLARSAASSLASYAALFLTSLRTSAAWPRLSPPALLYSARRRVALPAWLTQSWNFWAASPSQPSTLCFLSASPTSWIVLAASTREVARVFSTCSLAPETIAHSCSCE
ncbi:hypothetical protein A6A28_33755 [Streptomyces sp. CB03578]|nr:hypothetical protein A6A28_33755 [Streptomyces sp. CB03578]